MRGERYYFHVEGSTQGEIEPMRDEIEMNIGNLEPGWEGVLDLYKFGNELSLDLHKSGNEFKLDLQKSGIELSLDLHINESPKWNSSLLDFLK